MSQPLRETRDAEQLTISLPFDVIVSVTGAVERGEYASSSDVVREALLDWIAKREMAAQGFASLKADIDRGMADLAEGKVQDFDIASIVEHGKRLLARR